MKGEYEYIQLELWEQETIDRGVKLVDHKEVMDKEKLEINNMSGINEFWYTRITYGPTMTTGEGENKVETKKEFKWRDSFNLNKMIRSMEFDGEMRVILDDGHDVTEEFPEENKKRGTVEFVKKRIYVQSEIVLKGDDIQRFIDRTSGVFVGNLTATTILSDINPNEVKSVDPQIIRKSI